jgi:hypothetical protein
MMMTELTTWQQRFEEALGRGDVDAVDEVVTSVPDELRSSFTEWMSTLTPAPADALPAPTQREREISLMARGLEPRDASLLATLASGELPASVLVDDAMRASGLDATAVAAALVAELDLGGEPGAEPRVTRVIRNVQDGTNDQAARLAPRAIAALAKVLGGSVDQLRRACEAAAASLQPQVAGALAREGHDGIELVDELAAEDDDAIDQLFNRSIG